MATTLETISKNAEVHAQARNLLAERVTALTDAQAAHPGVCRHQGGLRQGQGRPEL